MELSELNDAIDSVAHKCWGPRYMAVLDTQPSIPERLKMMAVAIFTNGLYDLKGDIRADVETIRLALIELRRTGRVFR